MSKTIDPKPIEREHYHGLKIHINNRIKTINVDKQNRFIQVNGTFAYKLKTWQQYFMLEWARSMIKHNDINRADKRAFDYVKTNHNPDQLEIAKFFESLNFATAKIKQGRILYMITEDALEAKVQAFFKSIKNFLWKIAKRISPKPTK